WPFPAEKSQFPPRRAFFSNATTSRSPASSRFLTAVMPEGPAPITPTRGTSSSRDERPVAAQVVAHRDPDQDGQEEEPARDHDRGELAAPPRVHEEQHDERGLGARDRERDHGVEDAEVAARGPDRDRGEDDEGGEDDEVEHGGDDVLLDVFGGVLAGGVAHRALANGARSGTAAGRGRSR